MIWQRLSLEWQYCIEGAWAAYCHGSLPHGAVVVDAQGNIVARGRNRIREQTTEGRQLAGNRLAHAEMNALLELDWRAVNVYGCKLYSTIQPCPMCIGAVRMAHMQEVHYAGRDNGAGATSLIDKTPFFESGNIRVFGSEDPELEILLMAIQVEATFSQSHPNAAEWVELMSSGVSLGAKLGTELFATGLLQQWKEEKKEAAFVLDQLHEQPLHLS
ncbi:MAG TPA: nucleoside deaminase [Ktedonobacteraceae bacterium]|nr:nucleoside deaminase [Ktedonobacteraceae bacterium]